MVKTPWEARVGMLLDPQQHPGEFVYSFKPPDSAMYGGAPRIDWFACDIAGLLWGIEVKSLPAGRKSFDPCKLVSPGQIQVLDSIVKSANGVAYLAVGCENYLHFYDWRKLTWLVQSARMSVKFPSVRLVTDADTTLRWSGPKDWKEYSLLSTHLARHAIAAAKAAALPGMGTPPPDFENPLLPIPQVPSPSTLRPGASIRMRRRKLLSELS